MNQTYEEEISLKELLGVLIKRRKIILISFIITTLLSGIYAFLPAFEKETYYYNQTWQKEIELSKEEKEIFEAYELIQYDMVSGEKYSKNFFK